MTNPISQQQSDDFEEFAKNLIKEIFKDKALNVKKTRSTKDGGYDVYVELEYQGAVRRLYFECKLRSSNNLGLRDIAANVIIAFNNGAMCFITLTNKEITQQNGVELTKYSEGGPMGIKVLVGSDIAVLARNNALQLPSSLNSSFVFSPATDVRKFPALRIDPSAGDLYTQFFEKVDAYGTNRRIYFNCIADETKIKQAISFLETGCALVIDSEPFSFEDEFIYAIAKQGSFRVLELDVIQYSNRESLLIDLLAELWGFDPEGVLSGLAEHDYDSLFSYLDNKEEDKMLAQVMARLLRHDHSMQSNEVFCYEVARYIVYTMRLRMDTDKCLVALRGLDRAQNDEVASFATGIVDMLKSHDSIPVPSVISTSKVACDDRSVSDGAIGRLLSLSHVKLISLKRPSRDAMKRYVLERWDWISDWQAESLVDYADADVDAIKSFVHAAEEIARNERADRQQVLTAQLQVPVDAPNAYLAVMPALWSKLGLDRLFMLCCLWGSSVPTRVLCKLDMQADLAVTSGAFQNARGKLKPASRIACRHIRSLSEEDSFALHLLALDLTAKLDDVDLAGVPGLRVHYYAENHAAVLGLAERVVGDLLRARQYALLCEILPLIVKSAAEQGDPDSEVKWRLLHLRIMLARKQASALRFNDLLGQFDKRVDELGRDSHETRLTSALFHFKSALRQSPFDDELIEAHVLESYYKQCIEGCFADVGEINPSDLLGLICSQHALFVKRKSGYQKALEIYESACAALPDSLELQRGLRSHQACMSLGADPSTSLENYQETIELFHSDDRCIGAPLHEYADVSMSLLLMGEYDEAISSANKAIEICDLNGGHEETGRALNIRGCARWHERDTDGAAKDFNDAIALMSAAKYRYYTWRSQLNLACLEASDNGNGSEKAAHLAQEAYQGFQEALGERGNRLTEELEWGELVTRREYAAFVAFGVLCETLRRPPVKLEHLITEFGLSVNEAEYREHVDEAIAGKVSWCPYSDGKRIFQVG